MNKELDNRYPYEITLDGCNVCIKNGMAGTYKVHQDACVVDPCIDNLTVLKNDSDENEYVTVLDLYKSKTGMPFRVTALYPKNFGLTTKQEVVDLLSSVAERPVLLECCLEDCNDLSDCKKKV